MLLMKFWKLTWFGRKISTSECLGAKYKRMYLIKQKKKRFGPTVILHSYLFSFYHSGYEKIDQIISRFLRTGADEATPKYHLVSWDMCLSQNRKPGWVSSIFGPLTLHLRWSGGGWYSNLYNGYFRIYCTLSMGPSLKRGIWPLGSPLTLLLLGKSQDFKELVAVECKVQVGKG